MPHDLFCPPDSLYRGNLHGHCTHSDGRNEPAEVVRLYREAGYDFTCLSDHYWTDPRFSADTICDGSALDSEDFITLISAELHCHDSTTRPGSGTFWRTGCRLISPLRPVRDRPDGRTRRRGRRLCQHPPSRMVRNDHEGRAPAPWPGRMLLKSTIIPRRSMPAGAAAWPRSTAGERRVQDRLIATDDCDVPADGFGGWVMVAARDLVQAPSSRR